ncbi:hypothetical protein [Lysobacter firmicutimachus]|uniref:Uncharacterized protein n=1 Tax=Lysobacter firmicutimachus TaxID=1792846 RepID=A0ABU8D2N4_9GAMM
MRKAATMSPVLIALMLLAGCGIDNKQPPANRTEPAEQTAPLRNATIVGSAESPDPVLERVRELERLGKVEDVVVMESFPVQIRLRAPQSVIDELQGMPRKGGLR